MITLEYTDSEWRNVVDEKIKSRELK